MSRYEHAVFLQLPDATRSGLWHYLEHHYRPGHFLLAVLSNDLREAVNRADDANLTALPRIAQWLMWHAPLNCWGSPEVVLAWLAARPMTKED